MHDFIEYIKLFYVKIVLYTIYYLYQIEHYFPLCCIRICLHKILLRTLACLVIFIIILGVQYFNQKVQICEASISVWVVITIKKIKYLRLQGCIPLQPQYDMFVDVDFYLSFYVLCLF
jgi:hypothetical protein